MCIFLYYINSDKMFQTNLTIDWDHTPAEYTCYGSRITPSKITPKIYCENIPKTYKVKKILYSMY